VGSPGLTQPTEASSEAAFSIVRKRCPARAAAKSGVRGSGTFPSTKNAENEPERRNMRGGGEAGAAGARRRARARARGPRSRGLERRSERRLREPVLVDEAEVDAPRRRVAEDPAHRVLVLVEHHEDVPGAHTLVLALLVGVDLDDVVAEGALDHARGLADLGLEGRPLEHRVHRAAAELAEIAALGGRRALRVGLRDLGEIAAVGEQPLDLGHLLAGLDRPLLEARE